MEYTNKFDVLWDVERNETKIFEMVVSKLIKNILDKSDANKFGDFNVSETFKQVVGTTNYEEFYNKYENSTNPYANFIISLVENLHTLNLYKFESLEEHLCVIEANNSKDLIHNELLSNVDDELASLELTKGIHDQVAEIIKDDLERAAQEAENDAKIKDDLDDIGNGDEDKEKDTEEEDDDKEEWIEPDESTEAALAEAAKFNVNRMSRDYEDASLEDVLKDMEVYDMDATRTDFGKGWDNFKTNIRTVLKSSLDDTEMETSGITDEKVKRDYIVGVLVDRTSPYIADYLRLILRATVSGVALAGILFAVNWVVVAIWATIYFLLIKDMNKTQIRMAASYSISINAIRLLKEMKAKAKTDEEFKKYDIMIDDIMKRQGITQKNISDYDRQMKLVKDMNDGYVKVKENITVDMRKISSSIVQEIRESNNLDEVDAHQIASSATLTATVLIVAEMFGLKTKEEIQELMND